MHYLIPRSVFRSLSICFFLLHIHATVAQETSNTIVAKTGDGIFSVLRKSGIHPINYYEQFLNLNADNIKNGSELIVGKEYILPDAPDSFKRTGVRIDTGEEVEAPIFNETELSLMNQKDTTLQNTVYYFVHSGGTESKIVAACSDSLSLVAKKEMYGNFSSAINKKYLRHKGTYQRVILIEDAFGPRENSVVRISHNPKSREGRQFASVLENVLRKNTSVPVKGKNEPNPFKDDASLYFANNLVPPIVILNFTDGSKPLQGGFNLKSEKKPLVGLLNDGILEDYSQLNFEN